MEIVTRQIKDGAITDAKVAAGAGIISSKLADGANFIKKDGSVAMTGALNLSNQGITNLATPSGGTDAVNKNYVDNQIAALNSFFDSKGSVKAASTGNVSLTVPGTAIDGITLTSGDRVLLKNQTAPAENGIYTFNGAAAALTRTADFDAWAEIPGGFVAVEEGSSNSDSIWLSTANQGGTIGTTAITFQQIPTSAGLSNSNFVDKELPSGAINGVNTTFTLANAPIANSEHVFVNGLLMESGASADYVIVGATITMQYALATGEKLRCSYRK